jgi:hypothetical protein
MWLGEQPGLASSHRSPRRALPHVSGGYHANSIVMHQAVIFTSPLAGPRRRQPCWFQRPPDPLYPPGRVELEIAFVWRSSRIKVPRWAFPCRLDSDSEFVTTRAGGDPERPVRAASSDAGPEPGRQPAGVEEALGRFEGQAVADEGAARVGLLGDAAGLRDQWQQVQGTFVDDPQRAVHQASVLVERTLDEIRVNGTRGHTSDTTSTEDLRISFQRYREFFQRLLSA